jgi:hypothetical protein
LKKAENDGDLKGGLQNQVVNDFDTQMKDLNKKYNEAKDNGKIIFFLK